MGDRRKQERTDDLGTLSRALADQQEQLQNQGSAMRALQAQVQELAPQLGHLTHALQNPPPAPPAPASPAPAPETAQSPPPRDVSLPSPERFSGEGGDCGGFLFQCSLISFILGLLTGRALRWAEARFPNCQQYGQTFATFVQEFKTVFAATIEPAVLSRRLWAVKQRGRPVSDFALEFRTLAAAAGWESRALKAAFFQALDEPLKDELARVQEPESLEELIALTRRLDNRLRSRRRTRFDRFTPRAPAPPLSLTPAQPAVPALPPPEPMQIGRVRLSLEERSQRREQNLCIYCASPDHYIASLGKPADPKNSPTSLSTRLCLPAAIISAHINFPISALVDSGCDFNLIDPTLVRQAKIELELLPSPLLVSALDGGSLPRLTHRTKPFELVVSGNHREVLTFYVFPIRHASIVLGFPWLLLHNPHLNWAERRVESWSTYCHSHCLQSAVSAGPIPEDPLNEDPVDLSLVPKLYWDLKAVFSKSKAKSPPPHRPYDCTINLLPGAPLPSTSLGYQPPLFPADEKQITVTSVAHHIHRCQQVWDQTIHSLRRFTGQIRQFADRRRVPAPHYLPGQRVWLSSKDLPHRSTSRKLAPRFTGPYVIDSIVSPSAVRLRLSPRSRIHPTFHVSQLKPVHSSPLCPPTEPPPPPPNRVGRQVRRIVDSRCRGRGWQYLVHWEGCGPEDRSWVPGSSISDPSLVFNFWSSRPSSSSGPPGGDR
uniref:Chromo domain-containing protein n=1 Tax=Fundulus heteroclitus TaxID=8078 RepID=A0A3Q2TMV6_FUNHE